MQERCREIASLSAFQSPTLPRLHAFTPTGDLEQAAAAAMLSVTAITDTATATAATVDGAIANGAAAGAAAAANGAGANGAGGKEVQVVA